MIKARSKVTKKVEIFSHTRTPRDIYRNLHTGATYGKNSFEYMYDIVINDTKEKIKAYLILQNLSKDLIDKMTEDIYNITK